MQVWEPQPRPAPLGLSPVPSRLPVVLSVCSICSHHWVKPSWGLGMPCSSFSSFSSSSVFLRTGRPDRWLYESLSGPGTDQRREISAGLLRPPKPCPRPDGACGPRHPPERGAAPAVLQAQAAGQAPAALEGVLPEPRAAAAAPTLVRPAPQWPGLRYPLVQGGRAQAPKLVQMAKIRVAPIRTHTH